MTPVNFVAFETGTVNLAKLARNVAERLSVSYGRLQLRPVWLGYSSHEGLRACDFRWDAEVTRTFLIPANAEIDGEFAREYRVIRYSEDGSTYERS